MNKLILFSMLAVVLCCAKENCEFLNIDEERYSSSLLTAYNFRCTGIKGYDYVEHEVLVQFNSSLDAVFSSYYIDDKERKSEYFNFEENEKKNGDVEYIGHKCVFLYDEFHIEMKEDCSFTSLNSMKKILLNKWNKLKRYINE